VRGRSERRAASRGQELGHAAYIMQLLSDSVGLTRYSCWNPVNPSRSTTTVCSPGLSRMSARASA
jgi:hypothetical protein